MVSHKKVWLSDFRSNWKWRLRFPWDLTWVCCLLHHVYFAFSCFFCPPLLIQLVSLLMCICHMIRKQQWKQRGGWKVARQDTLESITVLRRKKKCKRKFAFEKVWVSFSSIFPLISPYPVLPQPLLLVLVVAIATLVTWGWTRKVKWLFLKSTY